MKTRIPELASLEGALGAWWTLLIVVAMLAPVLLPAQGAQARDPVLVVVAGAFTDEVNPETREIANEYVSHAPERPLCLWMKVKGEQWALDRLREMGKLPIYHKWFRETYFSYQAEGSQLMIDEIPLDVGREDLIGKLGLELHHRGFFDWRTWSRKENICKGKWLVRVVYRDNTPVVCQDTGRKCEFHITVE